MEATIFVLSSLVTNLAGIYWHVPFTVIDPQHSFLERLVGSVQVSSTIYTLRYWRHLVFSEAEKCESICESCESPAQNASMELGDILKNVMDDYVQKQQNLTVPCPTNIGNSCSDPPPPLTTIHHTLFGRTFDIPLDQNSADLYWTVFFTALVLIAIILVLWKEFPQGSRRHDTDATSTSEETQSPQAPGPAKGKSSGKHAPRTPHSKPDTSTSSTEHEKTKEAGAASAQVPSKPDTPTSTEMSKSMWAKSTPDQAQPAKTPTDAGAEGGNSHSLASAQAPSKPDTPTSEMSTSMWAKSTPAKSQPAKTPTYAGAEGGKSDSPALAQAPSKPDPPTSAEISKSKWGKSTPAMAQPAKAPAHAGAKGSKPDSPALAQAPSEPDTPKTTSAEMSNSKWPPSTTTQGQAQTPTPAGVEGGKLANPASAQAPSKPDTPASAEPSKSKLADFLQKASPAQAPRKLYAPASTEVGKSRWADPALAKTQSKTPTRAGSERSQLAAFASAKAPSKLEAPTSAELSKCRRASPASAEEPSKLAAPASAGLSKSSWPDDSPTTAQRRKSVSLPSERNKEGDIGETY